MTPPQTFRPLLNARLLNALRRSARDEHGSALVEAAMSMILLLVLIFGVIEVSWAVYSFHLVANAAHEGARYAIVRGKSWSGACANWGASQCKASSTDVANYVANRSMPGVGIDPSQVCVQWFSAVPSSTPTSCTPNANPNSNAQGNIVQVTVDYPFTLNVFFLPARTFHISSTSQMVIAQ